jgi:hypothetical protein
MAKSVKVDRIGKTDSFRNADVVHHENGALVVSEHRPRRRTTYAHGRWTQVVEEGLDAND